MGLTFEDYDAVGVTQVADRRRLFELVHRVREVSLQQVLIVCKITCSTLPLPLLWAQTRAKHDKTLAYRLLKNLGILLRGQMQDQLLSHHLRQWEGYQKNLRHQSTLTVRTMLL